MDIVLLFVALIVPLWLNVKATLLVWGDCLSERPQRIAQLLLVWLLPLIGAIIVLGVHRCEEKSPRAYPTESEADYDHFPSGSALRKISDAVDGD